MPTNNKQAPQPWIKKATDQLKKLCRDASAVADEGDVLPSKQAMNTAVKTLQTFQRSPRPKIILTINGEIGLSWNHARDEFHAYIQPNGSVQFFHNRKHVDKSDFSTYLVGTSAVTSAKKRPPAKPRQ